MYKRHLISDPYFFSTSGTLQTLYEEFSQEEITSLIKQDLIVTDAAHWYLTRRGKELRDYFEIKNNWKYKILDWFDRYILRIKIHI